MRDAINNTKMTESDAIKSRHSVRKYLDKPIEAEKIEAIQKCIDLCNREGGVHFQLVTNEPDTRHEHLLGRRDVQEGQRCLYHRSWRRVEMRHLARLWRDARRPASAEENLRRRGPSPRACAGMVQKRRGGGASCPDCGQSAEVQVLLHDDNRVEAQAKFSIIGYAHLDLGIAKYHFEIGAGVWL